MHTILAVFVERGHETLQIPIVRPIRQPPKRCLIISQAPPWCIGVLSARRRPQPMSTASIARFRCARRSTPAETPRRSLPCSADSPLPTHTPRHLATFTRRMPAAMSGLRRPQSAASYANRRTAASLKLISRLVLICPCPSAVSGAPPDNSAQLHVLRAGASDTAT